MEHTVTPKDIFHVCNVSVIAEVRVSVEFSVDREVRYRGVVSDDSHPPLRTYELDYYMGTYTDYISRLSELHVDLFSASDNDKGS